MGRYSFDRILLVNESIILTSEFSPFVALSGFYAFCNASPQPYPLVPLQCRRNSFPHRLLSRVLVTCNSGGNPLVYSRILIHWIPTLQAPHPSLLAYVSPRNFLALFFPRRFCTAILGLHPDPFDAPSFIVFRQSLVFSLTPSSSSSPPFVASPHSHVTHFSSHTSFFSSMRCLSLRYSGFALLRFQYVAMLL
jgi:hypothetical protein